MESFLYKYTDVSQEITWNPTTDKIAVIIEPRKHKLLQSVVCNVMYHLGNAWNLMIVSHDIEYVKSLFPKQWTFATMMLNKDSITSTEYNQLLKTQSFWEKIPCENILIFQTIINIAILSIHI